ncbi:MAG: PD40 domain-containing protein [Spirochaetales bacterium]|nr:PD40 domain-containing protein [Spirochaetales bacterium]
MILQNGHHGSVSILTFNKDNSLLITGSDYVKDSEIIFNNQDFMPDSSPSWIAGFIPPEVKVWDITTGNLLFSTHGGTDMDNFFLDSCLFPASGDTILIKYDAVETWNIYTGKKTGRQYYTTNSDSAYSRERGLLVTIDKYKNGVMVFDLTSQDTSGRIVAEDIKKPYFTGFLQKGNALFIVADDNNAHIISTTDWKKKKSFPITPEFRTSGNIALASEKELLAVDEDKVLAIIDINSEKRLKEIPIESSAHNFIFSPDGNYFAYTPLVNKPYEILSISEAKKLDAHKEHQEYGVHFSFIFSNDGKSCFIGYTDGSIRMVETISGKLLKSFGPARIHWPTEIVFSTSTDRLYTANGSVIREWDLKKADVIRTFSGHTGRISDIKIDETNKIMASSDENNTIIVWDLEKGDRIVTIPTNNAFNKIALSGDGKYIAFGTRARYDKDFSITLLDYRENKKIRQLKGHNNLITFLDFLPDGRLLSAGYDKKVKIWDTLKGRVLKNYTISYYFEPRDISPDGNFLVLGDMVGQMPGELQVMDITKGNVIFRQTGYNFQHAFFNDDRTSVTVFNHLVKPLDKRKAAIELWDYKKKTPNPLLSVNEPSITIIKGCPVRDQKIVACMCADGTIRLLDIRQEKTIAFFYAVGNKGYIIKTPDGYYKVSGEGKKAIAFMKGRTLSLYENNQPKENAKIIEQRIQKCLAEDH